MKSLSLMMNRHPSCSVEAINPNSRVTFLHYSMPKIKNSISAIVMLTFCSETHKRDLVFWNRCCNCNLKKFLRVIVFWVKIIKQSFGKPNQKSVGANFRNRKSWNWNRSIWMVEVQYACVLCHVFFQSGTSDKR